MPVGRKLKTWKDRICAKPGSDVLPADSSAAEGDDFAVRLHAFEIFCKWAMQLRGPGYMASNYSASNSPGLESIGKKHFDLTSDQIKYCVQRAKNFLEEIREHERARNAASVRAGKRPAILSWEGLRPKLQLAA